VLKPHSANRINSSVHRFFHVEWHSFWVLIKMLLANSFSFDWKNKKKAILKIVTGILGFAAVAAISYVFFYFCIVFGIFSLLAFVPMSVPSIIVTILLIFSFCSSLGRVTEDLYFSNDNKVLLTLPTDGNTLFLARLFVSFVNTYMRALLLEIPFLIGYFLISKYPVYMYFVVFLIWALIDLTMLLLASLFSVPTYFIKRFLRTNTLAHVITTLLLIAVLLSFCSFLIAIIPDEIDVFSNWGAYFYRIQNVLSYYRNNLSFFYKASMLYLGEYSGFAFSYFSKMAIDGLWAFLIMIGALPLLFVASLSLASPLYLKLASGTGELQSKSKKGTKKERPPLSPIIAQLKKEFALFVKDPSVSSPYVGVFLALPLIVSLVSKLFAAMDVNSRGEGMVQVASLLIVLLIALNANATIAHIYSQEGGAFKLGHTYPLKDDWTIGSKLIIPSIIGILSLLASIISMAFIRPQMAGGTIMMGVGAVFIYVGHLLYSAGLDFSNPKNPFGEASFLSSNENRSAIMAFITAALVSLLYYFYLQDGILWLSNIEQSAGFKVLLIGLLYLALNIILYVRKIRYIYKTGEPL